MTLARTHSWPEGHWGWPIHLSHKHGLRCGEMIFVGGQVDLDSVGNVRHSGDLETQTGEVMGDMARVLEGFVFGVTTTHAPTFSAMAGALVLAALLACYLPARRATLVDPIRTLRTE